MLVDDDDDDDDDDLATVRPVVSQSSYVSFEANA